MQDQITQIRLRNIYKVCLNNYQKIREISKGGFGCVYLIRKKNTNEYYAAKIIKYFNEETTYKLMINREISIMMRITHSTLIRFIGYSLEDFEGNNNVTIIMEYHEKGSLSKYLQDSRTGNADIEFDNTKRQIILIGIAYGMSFLHKNHIIHRDLKPSNILLDNELKPHIIDFGLSKFYEEGKPQSSIQQVGTKIYMSPETIEENVYNEKTDVYSFGILMFEVITNQIPYPDFQNGKITEYKFNNQVVQENFRPIFDFPVKDSIKNLIKRCWSKNSNERPTFEELFNKLAFNDENWIIDVYDGNENENEYDISKYFLDGVNSEEILEYVEYIQDTTPFEELKKENEHMKTQIQEENIKSTDQIKKLNNIILEQKDQIKEIQNENKIHYKQILNLEKVVSVSGFNNLQLISQMSLISHFIEKNNQQDKNSNSYFDFYCLLKYFMSTNLDKNGHYLEVLGFNDKDFIVKIEKIDEIHILKDATSVLFQDFVSELEKFIDIIKPFKRICVDIQYPSKSFDNVYSNLVKLKETCENGPNIEICIFISGIIETDEKFIKNKIIKSIILDKPIKTIKYYNIQGSFQGCSSLEQIKISPSCTSIETNAFSECKSLKQISIPSSVTQIGYASFYNCSLLEQVSIPSSIILIKKYTFRACSSLTQITIPSSVTKIEDFAFANCSSLTKISFQIPSNVTLIGSAVFSFCPSLTKIKIPSSVTSFGDYVFYNCSSLKKISIPSSIDIIRACFFYGCSSLNIISIPSSVHKIEEQSFIGVKSLTIIGDIKIIVECMFAYCESLTQIAIPSSVTSIGDSAFAGCSSLTQITIPSSVTSIGDSAFAGCSSLTQITIPSSVTSIGNSAFSECSSLTQITIPSSVTSIGNSAFAGCSSLTQITIPSSVTSIGNSAFSECSSLTQITIPSSVTSIGTDAFSKRINIIRVE